ncbi:MAG TPA: cation:proton antiporter [Gemmatimonadales bacterium]|nr:cation:proton antiporter [Gemmatimonadales bacterium]
MAPEAGASLPQILLTLAAILAGAKLVGELAERVGQPAVLGELLAGVLLGPSILGLVHPDAPWLGLLAELGVIVLLFEIGLETDLKRLLGSGGTAATVALVGVALPFLMGFGVGEAFGLPRLPSIVVGAALTATSVGITARVLSDLGRLQDAESQVVLGAAVLDDIVGLVILTIVSRMVAGGEVTLASVGTTTAIAFGFVAAALLVGRVVVPPLFGLLARLGNPASLAPMALALALLVSVLAAQVGSALIIGAFTAGLLCAPTAQRHDIEQGVTRLGHFFVPIFFVSVGAAVDVRTFANPAVLGIGVALVAVAVVGKVLAGFAPVWFKGRKLVVGVGMVPRGEVGLIFAQTGLASGVLDAGLFSAVTLMVIVSTFLAPPALKALLGPRPGRPGAEAGGSASLVSEA